MSNSIAINKKKVLRLSNGSFEALYNYLYNVIETSESKDHEVINFIEKMDQSTYGTGCIYRNIN